MSKRQREANKRRANKRKRQRLNPRHKHFADEMREVFSRRNRTSARIMGLSVTDMKFDKR